MRPAWPGCWKLPLTRSAGVVSRGSLRCHRLCCAALHGLRAARVTACFLCPCVSLSLRFAVLALGSLSAPPFAVWLPVFCPALPLLACFFSSLLCTPSRNRLICWTSCSPNHWERHSISMACQPSRPSRKSQFSCKPQSAKLKLKI